MLEQGQERFSARITVLMQVQGNDPLTNRQAADPAACLTRLRHGVRRQQGFQLAAKIKAAAGIDAEQLAHEAVGDTYLEFAVEYQHALLDPLAQCPQRGRRGGGQENGAVDLGHGGRYNVGTDRHYSRMRASGSGTGAAFPTAQATARGRRKWTV